MCRNVDPKSDEQDAQCKVTKGNAATHATNPNKGKFPIEENVTNLSQNGYGGIPAACKHICPTFVAA